MMEVQELEFDEVITLQVADRALDYATIARLERAVLVPEHYTCRAVWALAPDYEKRLYSQWLRDQARGLA